MNPTKKIGRYLLPIGSVAAIEERNTSGWRRLLLWRKPGYNALLNNGRVIHFTEAEKAEYENAIEWHVVTLEWYGAAKGMGLRG
jgi:hypothetical protein